MANRFLRGTGNRNWNDTANWSTTSGGAGGASVPTLSDAVIFDQNSGIGDVTLNANASCASFNSTALTQIVRVVSSVYNFSNYGDLTLNGTLSKFAFTGTAYYYQKGTGGITTNGNLFLALNRLYIDGVGITVTNLDDMNVGNTSIYPNSGMWNMNGKSITFNSLYTQSTNITFNLSSSIINCLTWSFQHAATINSGTSTINTNGFYSLSATYFNIVISTITTSTISLAANITVSNNLTFTGLNASNYRLLIASNTIGTPRTITCNGTVTATNVDFRDITLAGTCNKDLSAITGGSGDCGGNSGIVFTMAQAQYFKKHASTALYGDVANWFTDLALTIGGRVPLPQDLGSKFLAGSFNQTCTVSCNVPRIPCLDMSEVVNTVTWSLANAIEVYGSYVLGANITPSGNYAIYLMNQDYKEINTFGKLLYQLYSYKGFLKVLSNLDITNNFVNDYNCQTDFNNYNLTCRVLQSQSAVVNVMNPAIYLRNGIFTIKGITGNSLYLPSTVDYENSLIIVSPLSGGANIGIYMKVGNLVNKIQLSGEHTGNIDIILSSTISELIIDSGRKVRFTAGTTQTINKLTAIGTQVAPITIESITAGSRFNLAYTGVNASTVEYCSIKDSKVTQARRLLAKNSTNVSNNQNWGFAELPPFALNGKQVDEIYYGVKVVEAMYIGENKIC